jgi:adenine-specific DNA-methyltransferase
MGTQSFRFESVRNLSEYETERQKQQIVLDANNSLKYRREQGQFSTPYGLAKEIVKYGLKTLNSNQIHFLEPAIGTGVFYSALLPELKNIKKDLINSLGVEKDTTFASVAEKIWSNKGLAICNDDFIENQPQYPLL